ncbi:MAG: PAS domain S-box protein [Betaproteobacteria bacterium]|nr:MAG: PAS domain S-box protein [Betaproteobacteria bacterium]
MGVDVQTPASSQALTDHVDAHVEVARLRDELALTRRMLDDAQRLTRTGSWIVDATSGAGSGSVEFFRILGLPGKTSSAHFTECLTNVHPDDLPAVLEGFQESVATGESRPLHYRVVAADGSTTDIETVAQPIRDETGRVVRVVGTVMDVTERNRVQEALRASEKSRQAAVMAERDRVVRDVHDTLAHAFTGVIVQLEAADDAASRGLEAEAGAHVARAEAMARAGLQEARRSVMALRPQALEGNDLSAALRELVMRMTDGTSVISEFAQGGVARRLPPAWDEHLLRIGQEALTNAIRHGRAQRIVMELDFSDDAVQLRLTDDGRGFDTSSAFDGLGLAGIKARASSIGGHLSISSAAGSGTTISVSVPHSTPTAP